jgi:hypothetical protein
MANFQGIVLMISVIIFIIAVLLIGYILYQGKSKQTWPPLVGDCPDYWVDMSGKGSQCVNVQDLGTCHAPSGKKHLTMDFSVAPYVGNNSSCSKYQWANRCGVTWDGITYGVNNPCSKKNEN